MKTRLFAALLFVPLLFITSCKKTEGSGLETGRMTVRMTDAPSPYGFEEINIDVQSVEVHFSGGNWYKLHTQAGIYNVLTLCNGIDTLIVDEAIPAGQITSVRLNLGVNNSLRKDGVLYPLAVPSGEESGLKVIFSGQVGSIPMNMFIDFDAGESIVEDGHGSYHLKPVIRAFTEATTGSVQGSVDVLTTSVTISFFDGTHTFTAYTNPLSGRFLIRGLTPGSYTMTVFAADGHTALYDVAVTAKSTTDVGILHVP